MGKYRVIDCREEDNNIKVVVENEIGKRRIFPYPLGKGYGELNMNGDIRAVALTLEKLRKEEERKERANKSELESIKNKREEVKGTVYEIKDDGEIPGKKKVEKN